MAITAKNMRAIRLFRHHLSFKCLNTYNSRYLLELFLAFTALLWNFILLNYNITNRKIFNIVKMLTNGWLDSTNRLLDSEKRNVSIYSICFILIGLLGVIYTGYSWNFPWLLVFLATIICGILGYAGAANESRCILIIQIAILASMLIVIGLCIGLILILFIINLTTQELEIGFTVLIFVFYFVLIITSGTLFIIFAGIASNKLISSLQVKQQGILIG